MVWWFMLGGPAVAAIAINNENGKAEFERQKDKHDVAVNERSAWLEINSPTVYVTPQGDSYHTFSHYPYVDYARKLHEAQEQYSPCLNCHPPAPMEIPELSVASPTTPRRAQQWWIWLLGVGSTCYTFHNLRKTGSDLRGRSDSRRNPEDIKVKLARVYRSMDRNNSLIRPSISDDEIHNIHMMVSSGFLATAGLRKEDLSNETIARIVMNFLVYEKDYGSELLCAHLDRELAIFYSSGLRPFYDSGSPDGTV